MQEPVTMQPVSKRTNRLEQTLKNAMKQSPMPRAEISRATGITESSLSRFVAGKHDLCLDAADRLLRLFEIELRQRRREKRRP